MPSNLPIADVWFTQQTLPHGVTWVTEPHVDAFARCNIWHVRGRERDLVIDTGLGLRSLREAATHLFDRPVTAVLTHGHYDHTGGAYEFADRLAHRGDADQLEQPGFAGLTMEQLGDDMVRRLRAAGYDPPPVLLTALPGAGFDLKSFAPRAAPATALIEGGDRVDLGDRSFEVLHLPGHSPGSIALWEAETGTLFSGDASMMARCCINCRGLRSAITARPSNACSSCRSMWCTLGMIRASDAHACARSPRAICNVGIAKGGDK